MPYYADDWLTVHQGDARTVLATMPAESVHCVVTSPPYWGLRDYGTATWAGGEAECDHRGADHSRNDTTNASHGTFIGTRGTQPAKQRSVIQRDTCGKCGATRIDSQLGLEPTPDEYVANMVEVFREVRRVLRDDGTLWLNLGDSYANTGGMTGGTSGKDGSAKRAARMFEGGYRPLSSGLKPKDLVGIPWRVAFALQADGWYLRSDIIWSKPNPMPESVTDRPTKSHEYVFLLSKSARYYFDADAVREGQESAVATRAQMTRALDLAAAAGLTHAHLAAIRSVGITDVGKATVTQNGRGKNDPKVQALADEAKAVLGGYYREFLVPSNRNSRSVWTIATQPYPGAHFAVFPRKLVEPCIKAGCPEGGTVLDPFAGSGTTGLVAQALSRRAVLIDLNGDYLAQALRRNQQIPLIDSAWDESMAVSMATGRPEHEVTRFEDGAGHRPERTPERTA